MEPLFFKAENQRKSVRSAKNVSKLQWSRFFSKRKMLTALPKSCAATKKLQWSRFFSKRKIRNRHRQRIIYSCMLQWSRFFSKRKICRRSRMRARILSASMEPLFFKAENEAIPASSTPAGSCFNGAAFFQSGK